MAQYDFHYLPLEGKITGKQVLQQTEDAINDLGNRMVSIETDTEAITEAVEIAQDAKNTADNAETIANDAMDVAHAERESAQEAAQEANQAATNAANSASSASATATQLMEYLATKEEITAPAVDPTLTISGAAADAKVTGDAVYNLPLIESDMGFWINSSMLEPGRIDDSGVPVAHNSRCRTKYFIPVKAGDVIRTMGSSSLQYGVLVSHYDVNKVFISNDPYIYFYFLGKRDCVITTDGYVKLTFTNADASLFNNCVEFVFSSPKSYKARVIETTTQKTILPVPSTMLEYGYRINGDTTVYSGHSRVKNSLPIPIAKGDELHFTQKGDYYCDIGFSQNDTTWDFRVPYTNMPSKAPADGYAYFQFKNADNSDFTSITPLDKLITIKRAKDIGKVEDARSADLYNGYINENNNYKISNHAKRLVNWNPIHANKGDVIRINNVNLMYKPYEFDEGMNLLATCDEVYITGTGVGGNYPRSGDYIVQNDCWVMCTIAPIPGITFDSFTPADFDKVFSVIHMDDNRNINTAEDTMWHFPKSARKPTSFTTNAIASQGITVVNGKLWAAVDDNTDYIQVINTETGVVERTISHNLGHCNSLDYCPKTDVIITTEANGVMSNPSLIIVPNVSSITDSISKSNCVTISVPFNVIDLCATVCFGQDEKEVYIFTGYGSQTPYNLYRMILGYENGVYTGSITLDKVFTGTIRDNIDSYWPVNSSHYAQDCCYDGYFYMGYGVSYHNFLVFDLDEKHSTYRVVGNYLHHEYDANRNEILVEPEGIAIYNGKVFCSSRKHSQGLSWFYAFER